MSACSPPFSLWYIERAVPKNEGGQKKEKDMDWDGEVAGWLQGVKIARSKKVKAIRGEKSAAFVRGN